MELNSDATMFGGGAWEAISELMKVGPSDRITILINREREGTPCNQSGYCVKKDT